VSIVVALLRERGRLRWPASILYKTQVGKGGKENWVRLASSCTEERYEGDCLMCEGKVQRFSAAHELRCIAVALSFSQASSV
jgi:hypothetical protein